MLKIESLSVAYKGIRALREVDFEVKAGEIFALIGPNGAGKSTLLNAVSGIVSRSQGRIHLEEEDISAMPAHKIAQRGVIQVPEGRRIIAPLTVMENLELGKGTLGKRQGSPTQLQDIFDLFPILAQRRKQISGSLSGGQQQMLAIGRALMGRPRVLLLDEPSLGLAPVVTKEVFQALVHLNKAGLTILLVEQNAKLALETASNAAVLERGRIVYRGSASELANDPAVADHYFGRATA